MLVSISADQDFYTYHTDQAKGYKALCHVSMDIPLFIIVYHGLKLVLPRTGVLPGVLQHLCPVVTEPDDVDAETYRP